MPNTTRSPAASALATLSSLASVAALAALAMGCSHTVRTRAPTYTASTASLQLSDDLARVCMIQFTDTTKAPRFDKEESSLLYQDRAVLDQIATCVTTGPLKGRSLSLVGHADPRGEVEYNLVLGDQRARSAWKYLADRGVDKGKLAETSRGKLDATGTDETGWERDRRVDIVLTK
jgi:peptidoglycan-associated lipoprotein